MKEHPYYLYAEEVGTDFTMEICLDWFNQRLRVDDYRGNIYAMMERIKLLSQKNSFTKVFVKSHREHLTLFLSQGYMVEGIYRGYYRGSDAFCMALYFTEERRISPDWMGEDHLLEQVKQLPLKQEKGHLSEDWILRKMGEKDLPALATLYGRVFVSYPTPVHQSSYLQKMMEEGTLFYGLEHQGKLVSAASSEINERDYNAEITDCATDPAYRGKGLLRLLLMALEEDLFSKKIFCLYSLARSLSFGMNAVLHQLGYSYSGRLTRNCKIGGGFEDMSLWVKNPMD